MNPEIMEDNLRRAIEYYKKQLENETDITQMKRLKEMIFTYEMQLENLRM